MKQLLQHLGNGETQLAVVPIPEVRRGCLLIATRSSLVSLGTERMLVEFGKASWLEKARQQPDKVAQVLRKVKTDGLLPTLEAVRRKLDQPIALGYCNVGEVIAVGEGVSGYAIGDRVLSNGPHAEVVCVPVNLCAKVPEGVSDEAASFGVVGAIALQGVRLLQPTLGERVAVIGLGLIGLLTVQILRANGCDVLGVDLDPAKCALARQLGATVVVDLSAGEDPLSAAMQFSEGRSMDGVMITASTQSEEPMRQAAAMCRQRGRIVLVGVAGLQLNRADFYAKELSFQVSCSYGPGRYDPDYEERGLDYPFGLVRWTEQRNFEAVLGLLASGRLDVEPLITHRYMIDSAPEAYGNLSGGHALGIVLNYPDASQHGGGEATRSVALQGGGKGSNRPKSDKPCVAVIGAGNYAAQVLLPQLAVMGLRLKTLVTQQGVSGTHLGKKYGFETASTDADAAIADPEVDAVIIATRHDSHARYALAALKAGKAVFVEKPLAIKAAEMVEFRKLFDGPRPDSDPDSDSDFQDGLGPDSHFLLMVGFNRRFAPLVGKVRELLGRKAAPKAMIYTVNAGAIDGKHWTQDPEIGGGRIVGEACHFLDLCRYIAGSPIRELKSDYLEQAGQARDSAQLQVSFADGSIAAIHYLANGHPQVAKERLEIYCDGTVLELDNFKTLRGHGFKGFKTQSSRRMDKGHAACLAAFIDAVKSGSAMPIPAEEIMEVSEWILKA